MINTLVVSLKHATERRAQMCELLQGRHDLNWDFFDAQGPDSPLSLTSNSERQIAKFGRPLTNGEVGCFKSHYKVISEHAQQNKDDWLLVLEDDVWLDPAFNLEEVITYCDTHELTYCRLFAKAYKPAEVIGMLSGFRQMVRFKTDPYGTQAYLIHRKGAARFIDSVEHIDIPVDDEIGRFWRHGLYPVSVFPFPVVERSVPSSIETGRDQGNVQRVFFRPDLIAHRVKEKIGKILANRAFKLA